MHPCVHCCISYDSQDMDSPSVDEISVHQGWNQCPSVDEISVHQGWNQCPSVDEISVRQWMKSVSVNGWSQCPSVDEISVHQWMKSVSINGWSQCPSMDEISVHQWMKSVSINGWNQCPSMDEVSVHQWMKSVSINGRKDKQDVIDIFSAILCHHWKKKILPLQTIWMDLSGDMFSKGSLTKTNTVFFFQLCVKSEKQNQKKDSQAHTESRLMVTW